MSLTGILIGQAIASGVGNIGQTVLNQYNADKTRQFNREEAEKNRAFQKEMAQNNIKYAVKQANELGISPSLVLGSGTHSLGGSQASVSNPPTANLSNLGTELGKIANVLQEKIRTNANQEMNEDRLEAMKEMNEDRLEAMKDIQKMKNSVTSNFNNYKKHNYTKKDFDNIFTDLNNVEI